jgi:hypothetical protein
MDFRIMLRRSILLIENLKIFSKSSGGATSKIKVISLLWSSIPIHDSLTINILPRWGKKK